MQDGRLHGIGQAPLLKVTALRCHSAQVNARSPVDSRLDQVPIFDEFLSRRYLYEGVVDVAETLPVHAIRCGRQTEYDRVIVTLDDLLVRRRSAAVRFVYDDDVCIPVITTDECLDAGHLNGLIGVRSCVFTLDDPVRNLEVVQAFAALLDELGAVGEEGDLLPLLDGTIDDGTSDGGLTRTRRSDHEHATLSGTDLAAYRLDRFALIIAKDYLHLPVLC